MSSQKESLFSFLPKLFRASEQPRDSVCKEQRPQQDQSPPTAKTDDGTQEGKKQCPTIISMGTMGKICCQGDFQFDWKIENFSSLPVTTDSYCRSPLFECYGRFWYLRLIPNGLTQDKSEGFVGLFLMSGDYGCPYEARFSIGSKVSTGETEVWLNSVFNFRKADTGWGIPKGIMNSELFRRRDELVPVGILTLTLTFKEGKEIVVKKDVSVQTEDELDVADVSVQTMVEHSLADATVQTAVEEDVADDGSGEPLEKTGGDKVLQDIGELWLSGENSDAVIKVRGIEFKVHRTVLMARTPVLSAMFKHDTAEAASGEVTVDDCDPAVFEQLLHFIYTGEPRELNADNSPGLYVQADKYLHSEVKALCVQCMQDTIRPDIFCSVVTFSLTHGETELLEKAVDFLSRNMVDVMKTVEWQIFLREHSTQANEILIRAMEFEDRNERNNELT